MLGNRGDSNCLETVANVDFKGIDDWLIPGIKEEGNSFVVVRVI